MEANTLDSLRRLAEPFTGDDGGMEPVLQQAQDKRFVLLGETSHGTREFYRHRAALTRRLIEDCGFEAVAVEGDWPDAYRVNRYVRGNSKDHSAAAALSGFTRFPLWMWRNKEVLGFIEWLREHNAPLDPHQRVGFYGLDLYSLYTSVDEVLRYLESVDPAAAETARERYGCLDHTTHEPQLYGQRAAFGLTADCESEVVKQLVDLRQHAAEYLARDGLAAEDEQFQAEQNARVVRSAEQYYRAMYRAGVNTWNLRDEHMTETMELLSEHLQRRGGNGRIVVWAHNSHVGDARATQKSSPDEINIGQLARERYPGEVLLLGYTTYDGTVSAASDWGAPVELMRVRPGRDDSFEGLFHDTGFERFLLPLWRDEAPAVLDEWRLERAIGVIYRPETERHSHYYPCRLARQFDAVFHFDRSNAVHPLERTATWDPEQLPETYPFGV